MNNKKKLVVYDYPMTKPTTIIMTYGITMPIINLLFMLLGNIFKYEYTINDKIIFLCLIFFMLVLSFSFREISNKIKLKKTIKKGESNRYYLCRFDSGKYKVVVRYKLRKDLVKICQIRDTFSYKSKFKINFCKFFMNVVFPVCLLANFSILDGNIILKIIISLMLVIILLWIADINNYYKFIEDGKI